MEEETIPTKCSRSQLQSDYYTLIKGCFVCVCVALLGSGSLLPCQQQPMVFFCHVILFLVGCVIVLISFYYRYYIILLFFLYLTAFKLTSFPTSAATTTRNRTRLKKKKWISAHRLFVHIQRMWTIFSKTQLKAFGIAFYHALHFYANKRSEENDNVPKAETDCLYRTAIRYGMGILNFVSRLREWNFLKGNCLQVWWSCCLSYNWTTSSFSLVLTFRIFSTSSSSSMNREHPLCVPTVKVVNQLSIFYSDPLLHGQRCQTMMNINVLYIDWQEFLDIRWKAGRNLAHGKFFFFWVSVDAHQVYSEHGEVVLRHSTFMMNLIYFPLRQSPPSLTLE